MGKLFYEAETGGAIMNEINLKGYLPNRLVINDSDDSISFNFSNNSPFSRLTPPILTSRWSSLLSISYSLRSTYSRWLWNLTTSKTNAAVKITQQIIKIIFAILPFADFSLMVAPYKKFNPKQAKKQYLETEGVVC
jgi:hypothetical protein